MTDVAIQPFSLTGFAVLAVFLVGMVLIVFEAKLGMDKFKPALLMLSSLVVIGVYYYFSGNDAERFAPFVEMQAENERDLFALIIFMAFLWMVVELLAERGVFAALNAYLLARGLGAKGMFWATGVLSALLSPFVNNITTAMIFGKSIQSISSDARYTRVALCNIIIASNCGVWFLGTATTLMVVLAGKITVVGLLWLIPSALIGWVASAAVLQVFYLNRLGNDVLHDAQLGKAGMKKGAWGLVLLSLVSIFGAVWLNIVLHLNIEYAIGTGLGLIALYSWQTKKRGEEMQVVAQLQKVEWGTLLFFIGIVTGVAALNHVGWLSYLALLYQQASPTSVNVVLGVVSGLLDNVPVEAAALMANPQLDRSQWALNVLMVGIGGSLTVIGSAAGIMVMAIEKSYSFSTHLRFLPAILVNFLVSLAVWYVQFEMLGWG